MFLCNRLYTKIQKLARKIAEMKTEQEIFATFRKFYNFARIKWKAPAAVRAAGAKSFFERLIR
jgi:hypothetical protein